MSINLLPQKEKKHIKKLYKSRRIAVASWFFVALIVVSIVSLVPLYFFSEHIEFLTKNQQERLQRESINFNVEELEDQINLINGKVRALALNTNHVRIYDYVTDITENKRGGITISSLAFSETDSDQVIGLAGIANNRETLLAFRRDLEQKDYIDFVELPISNFAENADIGFSITITLSDDNE